MPRFRYVLVLGTGALVASTLGPGCAPSGEPATLDAAGPSDTAAPSDTSCRPCSPEGSRSCISDPGERCSGGCWRYEGEDTCWFYDVPVGLDGSGGPDAGPAADTGVELDALADVDTGAPPPDADPPDAGPPDAGPPVATDAGTPPTATYCIDIDVSNTCVMTVTPRDITIPADQIAYFCWRNRSRDYPVDVWLSYGGGYTDLVPGATWNEPPGHCLGPLAHDEYADVSTGCSSFRFLIHCL